MFELRPLTPDEIPILKNFLEPYPRQSCDYAIFNLMTWGKIYNNHYAIWREHLIIYNQMHTNVFFPVGPGLSSAELRELIEYFRERDPEAKMVLVPDDWQLSNPDLDQHFRLWEERDWADYVYPTELMVSLSGRKLAKKKNLISQFRRAYPDYQVLPLTKDKHPVLLRFTEKWRRERGAEGQYLDTEMQAIRNSLEMWDKIPAEGIIICHHNKISAYSVFSPLNADTATVHFEKFDPDMKGSAQIINWETAKVLQNRFKWINREQDIGLRGLRQAKLSYQPERLVPFIFGELKP